MGRKVIVSAMSLTGLGLVVNTISVCLPMHRCWFFTAGFIDVMAMSTYTLRSDIDFGSSSWCAGVRQIMQGKEFCSKVDGSRGLEEVKGRFCAPLAQGLFPEACMGMQGAFWNGLVLVIAVFINAVANGVATFLLYQYMTTSPKKKYRYVALGLQIGAVCLLFLAVVAYIPSTLMFLDSIRLRLGIMGFADINRGGGTSVGYIGLWTGITVQLIVIGLFQLYKSSMEERYAEARESHAFMTEMQQYNAGLAQACTMNAGLQGAGCGQAYGQGYGQGYGQDPSQAYGQGYGQSSPYGIDYGQQPVQGPQYYSTAAPTTGYSYGTRSTVAPPTGWGSSWEVQVDMRPQPWAPQVAMAPAAAPPRPYW